MLTPNLNNFVTFFLEWTVWKRHFVSFTSYHQQIRTHLVTKSKPIYHESQSSIIIKLERIFTKKFDAFLPPNHNLSGQEIRSLFFTKSEPVTEFNYQEMGIFLSPN